MRYGWTSNNEAIVIHKADVVRVHDYARNRYMDIGRKGLRDYLLIRLPMKIGIRTKEICTFRIEDINLHDRTFKVLDSKRHEKFPLPLDDVTLELILELVEEREKGYVFQRLKARPGREGKPLRRESVYIRVRQIGEEAGVEGFHPRVLRRYFAATWVYGDPDLPPQQRVKGSLETLRRILRHAHLGVTTAYVSKLVFFEDIQREYNELQASPIRESRVQTPADVSGCIHAETCRHYRPGGSPEGCIHTVTCKYYAPTTEPLKARSKTLRKS